MTLILPFDISDQSLTFYARRRPWTVPKDNGNFEELKTMLTNKEADVEVLGEEEYINRLVTLADPKVALTAASKGKLEWAGDDLVYNGEVLHNLWVDKILAYRKAGIDYQPVFNALESLWRNPEPRVRERLPLFLEQGKLGFLPDGRFAGFKAVQKDFKSLHTGPDGRKVDWTPGTIVEEDRAVVNPDPNTSCARGLHLGTFDYVINNGYGWSEDRAMLLVAVWPEDVVSVPLDYRGGKMRVCRAESLEQVDQAYANAILGRGTTVITGYAERVHPSVVPVERGPGYSAAVGDWVRTEDDSVYEVKDVGLADGETVLTVIDYDGLTFDLDASDVVAIADETTPLWLKVRQGDRIVVEGDRWVKDGTYGVESVDSTYTEGTDDDRIWILYGKSDEEHAVRNDTVKHIVREEDDGDTDLEDEDNSDDIHEENESPYLEAEVGDSVLMRGHGFLRDGWYTVSQIYENPNGETHQRVQVRTLHSGNVWIDNHLIKQVSRSQ